MKMDQPSEQAMKNLYKYLGRILPKYINKLDKLDENKKAVDKRNGK